MMMMTMILFFIQVSRYLPLNRRINSHLTAPSSNPTTTEREWTCKKCTLVNSSTSSVCIVCGGSKLKSISSVEDMTLRKGEFWTCSQCTLKNSLGQSTCSACKHVRESPIISGQLSNFRPYTEQNNITPIAPSHKTSSQNNSRQQQLNLTNTTSTILSPSSPGLQPPSNRTSRSPSPRHERYSGAIPKVCFFFFNTFFIS